MFNIRKLALISSCMTILTACADYKDFNKSDVGYKHEDKVLTLKMHRRIDGFTPLQFKYNEHIKSFTGTDSVVLDLNNGGGSVEATKAVISHMNVLKMYGVKVTTIVNKGSKCSSACTLIFANGSERIAHEDSVFLFHSPFIFSPDYDPQTSLAFKSTRDYQSRIIEGSRSYTNKTYASVDKDFAEFLEKNYITHPNKDYVIKAKDIKSKWNGFITKLVKD